jgi:hypothetical protein
MDKDPLGRGGGVGMAMTPEHQLQSRVRMYLDAALPAPGWWSSVDHAKKQSVQAGTRQKARGIRRGLPDVMIWYRGMFLGIELKVGRGDTSEAQDGFAAAMRANGFGCETARSVLDVDTLLRALQVPVLPSMRIAAMNHDAALALPQKAPKPRRSGSRKPWPPKRYSAAHKAASARYNAPPRR